MKYCSQLTLLLSMSAVITWAASESDQMSEEHAQSLSCSGQCGERRRLPCSCHVICYVINNCCEDFERECPGLVKEGREMLDNFGDADVTCSDKLNIFIVTSCEGKVDKKSIEDRVENNLSSAAVEMFAVTDSHDLTQEANYENRSVEVFVDARNKGRSEGRGTFAKKTNQFKQGTGVTQASGYDATILEMNTGKYGKTEEISKGRTVPGNQNVRHGETTSQLPVVDTVGMVTSNVELGERVRRAVEENRVTSHFQDSEDPISHVMDSVPVTDSSNGLVFINRTVFDCYATGQSVVIPWKVRIVIGGHDLIQNIQQDLIDQFGKFLTEGKTYYFPPEDLDENFTGNHCFSWAITTCSGNPETVSDRERLLCEMGTHSYVKVSSRTYKNIHCAKCNDVPLDRLRPAEIGDSGRHSLGLSVIPTLNQARGTVTLVSGETFKGPDFPWKEVKCRLRPQGEGGDGTSPEVKIATSTEEDGRGMSVEEIRRDRSPVRSKRDTSSGDDRIDISTGNFRGGTPPEEVGKGKSQVRYRRDTSSNEDKRDEPIGEYKGGPYPEEDKKGASLDENSEDTSPAESDVCVVKRCSRGHHLLSDGECHLVFVSKFGVASDEVELTSRDLLQLPRLVKCFFQLHFGADVTNDDQTRTSAFFDKLDQHLHIVNVHFYAPYFDNVFDFRQDVVSSTNNSSIRIFELAAFLKAFKSLRMDRQHTSKVAVLSPGEVNPSSSKTSVKRIRSLFYYFTPYNPLPSRGRLVDNHTTTVCVCGGNQFDSTLCDTMYCEQDMTYEEDLPLVDRMKNSPCFDVLDEDFSENKSVLHSCFYVVEITLVLLSSTFSPQM